MRDKFTPDDLPESVTRELYVFYGIKGYSAGEISVWDCDVSGEERILLTTSEVTVKIPKGLKIKDKVVDALKAEKDKVLANAHMKAKELQQKIDSLLGLEYQPSVEAMVTVLAYDNEVPF